jgi:4-aminobutyrate aminotransferase
VFKRLQNNLIERTKNCLAPCQAVCRLNFVLSEAKGVLLQDVEGNKYIDFFSGIAVCSTGHCHPDVVKAIKSQADKALHGFLGGIYFPQEPIIKFAERLKEIAPGALNGGRIFFCNSGAEAVEGGIKLARLHTKKPVILSFLGSFHGRTLGAASVTASKSLYRKMLTPFLAGTFQTPYPYCYRCIFKQEYPDCDLHCLNYIPRILDTIVPSEEVAAVLVEPIQGEGGYIVPPNEFFPRLKKICEEYSFLFIDDEVQTGFGRTGKMFACEYSNVSPDIMLMAKGIASGLPIGAIIASKEIMDTFQPQTHASTFGGNPLCCAAGLATVDVIQREKLAENAATMGAYMMKRFSEMRDERRLVGDVRGKGLMIGVELVKDKKSKEPAAKETDMLASEAAKRGLIISTTGLYRNVIRIAPPLIITKEFVEKGLEIMEDILKKMEGP